MQDIIHLRFLGYDQENCTLDAFAKSWDHNKQVLNEILKTYQQSKENVDGGSRIILAIASIGVEFMCISMFRSCCSGHLHNGIEGMWVERLANEVTVENALLDLREVIRLTVNRAERIELEQQQTTISREEVISRVVESSQYVNSSYGLFSIITSTPEQYPKKTQTQMYKIDKETGWHLIENQNGYCSNCINRGLLTSVICEHVYGAKIPLMREFQTCDSFLKTHSKLNIQPFAHVKALTPEEIIELASSRRSGQLTSYGLVYPTETASSLKQDMFYFLLAPLEATMVDSDIMLVGRHQRGCKDIIMTHYTNLRKWLVNIIFKYNEPTLISPLRKSLIFQKQRIARSLKFRKLVSDKIQCALCLSSSKRSETCYMYLDYGLVKVSRADGSVKVKNRRRERRAKEFCLDVRPFQMFATFIKGFLTNIYRQVNNSETIVFFLRNQITHTNVFTVMYDVSSENLSIQLGLISPINVAGYKMNRHIDDYIKSNNDWTRLHAESLSIGIGKMENDSLELTVSCLPNPQQDISLSKDIILKYNSVTGMYDANPIFLSIYATS